MNKLELYIQEKARLEGKQTQVIPLSELARKTGYSIKEVKQLLNLLVSKKDIKHLVFHEFDDYCEFMFRDNSPLWKSLQ